MGRAHQCKSTVQRELVVISVLSLAVLIAACSKIEVNTPLVECGDFGMSPSSRIEACTQLLAGDDITTAERFDALTHRGYIYYLTLEQNELALADYNAAVLLDVDLDPERRNRASLFFNRGRILAALEQYEAAVVDFALAASINERWTDPLTWSAQIKRQHLDDRSGAVADLDEAIRRRPGDAGLRSLRCEMLMKTSEAASC